MMHKRNRGHTQITWCLEIEGFSKTQALKQGGTVAVSGVASQQRGSWFISQQEHFSVSSICSLLQLFQHPLSDIQVG